MPSGSRPHCSLVSASRRQSPLRLTVASSSTITALGSGRLLGRVRRGRPLLSRSRGAAGSGAAAVESAADRSSRGRAGALMGWVGCEVRKRVTREARNRHDGTRGEVGESFGRRSGGLLPRSRLAAHATLLPAAL